MVGNRECVLPLFMLPRHQAAQRVLVIKGKRLLKRSVHSGIEMGMELGTLFINFLLNIIVPDILRTRSL